MISKLNVDNFRVSLKCVIYRQGFVILSPYLDDPLSGLSLTFEASSALSSSITSSFFTDSPSKVFIVIDIAITGWFFSIFRPILTLVVSPIQDYSKGECLIQSSGVQVLLRRGTSSVRVCVFAFSSPPLARHPGVAGGGPAGANSSRCLPLQCLPANF